MKSSSPLSIERSIPPHPSTRSTTDRPNCAPGNPHQSDPLTQSKSARHHVALDNLSIWQFLCARNCSLCVSTNTSTVVIRHVFCLSYSCNFLHSNSLRFMAMDHTLSEYSTLSTSVWFETSFHSRNCSGSHKIAKPSNHTKSSLAESISVERRTLGAEAARVVSVDALNVLSLQFFVLAFGVLRYLSYLLLLLLVGHSMNGGLILLWLGCGWVHILLFVAQKLMKQKYKTISLLHSDCEGQSKMFRELFIFDKIPMNLTSVRVLCHFGMFSLRLPFCFTIFPCCVCVCVIVVWGWVRRQGPSDRVVGLCSANSVALISGGGVVLLFAEPKIDTAKRKIYYNWFGFFFLRRIHFCLSNLRFI